MVGAAYTAVPAVQAGVHDLASDVQCALGNHRIHVRPGQPSIAPSAPSRPAAAPKAPAFGPATVPGAPSLPRPYLSLPSHATVTPVVNNGQTTGTAGALLALAFVLAGLAYRSARRGLTAAEEQMAHEAAERYAAAGGNRQMLENAYQQVDRHHGDVQAAMNSPMINNGVYYTTDPPAPPPVYQS